MPAMDDVDSMKEEQEVRECLAMDWLHHSFTLPATTVHGVMRVTFAVAGTAKREEGEEIPTVLLIGGLYGGRWLALLAHHIAEKLAMRVVCFDRPGMGGSTPISTSQRIPLFLETVPALLAHLKINTPIALMAHSCGAIYALNTAYHLPHLLHPKYPSITLLTPWVHPAQSHSPMLTVAQYIPKELFNYWNSLAKGTVSLLESPVIGASAGALTTVSGWFGSGLQQKMQDESDVSSQSAYGLSASRSKLLLKVSREYLFAEDTTGANDDALLCLKKIGPRGWDACDDYATFFPSLVSKLKAVNGEDVKLQIAVYFAESDVMIGEKGRLYFEECWKGSGVEIFSEKVHGTDHDTILVPTNGIMNRLLEDSRNNLQK